MRRAAAADRLELPLEGFERPRVRPPEGLDRPRVRPPEGSGRPAVRPLAEPPRRAPRAARREPVRAPIEFEPGRERGRRGGLPRRQQILLPFIALIAIGAGGGAAIAITNEPQTSSLQQEVASLRTQIAGARQELATLQQVGASSAEVHRLSRTVAGLGRTVSGLQSSAVPVRSKVDALSVCIPQLQGELAGQSIQGSGKKASLVSSATISPGCAAVLGGG